MTVVSITYLAQAPEGFRLPTTIVYPIGLIVAIGAIAFFLMKISSKNNGSIIDKQARIFLACFIIYKQLYIIYIIIRNL